MDAPFLIVIGIGLEQLAAAQVISLCMLSYTEVSCVGIGLERPRCHSVVGISHGDVHAGAYIEAQRFEAMYLVVHGRTADETAGAGVTYAVVKL